MATRLQRTGLLEHPIREAIVELVHVRPGVSFLELHERLRARDRLRARLGYGNLTYHLGQLERFGYVTSRRAGRFRRYYENGGPQGTDTTALSVLQSRPVPELADALLDQPGICQRDLWRRFAQLHACSRQAVGYHLARMERAGLAVSAKRGRNRFYYATERLVRVRTLAPVSRMGAVPVSRPPSPESAPEWNTEEARAMDLPMPVP